MSKKAEGEVELKAGQLVAVTWTDAYSQIDDDNDYEDYPVTTYGVVVSKHGKFLKIASEVTPDQLRGTTHIPLSLITKVVKYGE